MIKKGINVLAIGILVISSLSCGGPTLPESVYLEYKSLPKEIDFNKDVKPILSDKCFACHGPDKAKIKGGLQLHNAQVAFAALSESTGKVAIKPGNLNKSEVFHRIMSNDPNYTMPEPSSHLTLSNYEKAVLTKWIETGAVYEEHWAFIKPKNYRIPETKRKDFTVNPIDNFILQRLEQENVLPSLRADKELLLRRLSFDLTGLPPSLEEMDSFLEDNSSNAYEKQVDRLLASPHYGEQMALHWMDLSRFADTHGYTVDRYRDMSPWRDWVIKSFNENMPYDQFLTWQLAGDLVENPSKEMILATAFNRIHPQNMEGGIVNEEFLVEYAVDRASTMGQAFMGLTVACARCHDHKYDPISHKNFYELTSFFNNIDESGQISWNDAMPVPTLLLTTDEQEKVLQYMNTVLEQSNQEIEKIENSEIADDFEKWLQGNEQRSIYNTEITEGMIAYFDLNDKGLKNVINSSQNGSINRDYLKGLKVNLSPGKRGNGVVFDGDSWLDLKEIGVFGRSDEFSISLWANIPLAVVDGNIFHKGSGAILYNWRGYHLKIVDNRLELMMAHTGPDNAIVEVSENEFPRDKWINLTMTYDGSSKASGLKLYVNGEAQRTFVKKDNLYKDILFGINPEPGLQLGARLRGKGIQGAVIDEIRVYKRELSAIEIMKLAENPEVDRIVSTDYRELPLADKVILRDHYTKVISKKVKTLKLVQNSLRKRYADSLEKIQEVMVMKESDTPVRTYILERGLYSAKGQEVFPNTPEFFFPMPTEFPKNRLGLAKWLVHEDHPLTARVAVNRYWQQYFGTGLVKTSEDFGNQGEMPSHPELLDWMAIQFMQSGWNVKELQKLIVMSNTYQQSSLTSTERFNADPENRLLARGPSKRLSGEMLRDNALAISGLLNRTIGGKSVRPYQPDGLWLINGADYKEDAGEKLYRRSMYTIWKRSVPNPTIATFDAPARDICTIRRQETNTPLQALVLLNDPTYIEASRVLGKKMIFFNNNSIAIATVFREITGRTIKKEELELLTSLHKEEYEKFKKDIDKAHGWLNTGQFKINLKENQALVAANAVVANTVLNADATITKR